MQNIYGGYGRELGRHGKHRNEHSVRNKACETQHCISIICGKTGLTYVLIFVLHCSSALYTGLTWRRPRVTQNTIPFLPTKKADCRLQFKKTFFSSNSYRKQILQGACQRSWNIVKYNFSNLIQNCPDSALLFVPKNISEFFTVPGLYAATDNLFSIATPLLSKGIQHCV